MVIEKSNKEGHNAAFNPVTIHCAAHGMEYRRFELGPPGESKLPLSNRKYTDFLKIGRYDGITLRGKKKVES